MKPIKQTVICVSAKKWEMEIQDKDKNAVLDAQGRKQYRRGVKVWYIPDDELKPQEQDDSTRGVKLACFSLPAENANHCIYFPAYYEAALEMQTVNDKDREGKANGKAHVELVPIDIKFLGTVKTSLEKVPFPDGEDGTKLGFRFENTF